MAETQFNQSPAVTDASKQAVQGVTFSPGTVESLEKMPFDAQVQAHALASILRNSSSVEASKYQKDFFKRVEREAQSPGAHLHRRKGMEAISPELNLDGEYSDQYKSLMQEMFNNDIVTYAKGIEKQEAEKAANKEKAESEKQQKAANDKQEAEEKKQRNENFKSYTDASTAVAKANIAIKSPASLLVGFAELLNSCANSKDEWILLVKLLQGLEKVIGMPLDFLQSHLESVAKENGSEEQYKKFKDEQKKALENPDKLSQTTGNYQNKLNDDQLNAQRGFNNAYYANLPAIDFGNAPDR